MVTESVEVLFAVFVSKEIIIKPAPTQNFFSVRAVGVEKLALSLYVISIWFYRIVL